MSSTNSTKYIPNYLTHCGILNQSTISYAYIQHYTCLITGVQVPHIDTSHLHLGYDANATECQPDSDDGVTVTFVVQLDQCQPAVATVSILQ